MNTVLPESTLSFFKALPSLRRNSLHEILKIRRASSNDSSEKARMKIGPYVIGKEIGEGAHSSVKLAFHAITRKCVALKIISKTGLEDPIIQQTEIRNEVNFLKALVGCEYVLKFEEYFETKEYLCLVLEHLDGGDLFSYVSEHSHIKEKEARRIFLQLVKAVQFIHKKGIVHRDLKLENILMDSQGNIKVSDFGLSTTYFKGSQQNLLTTFCGTMEYAAPEIIKRQPYDGTCSDVWSLGVILFACLSGCFPFKDDHSKLEGNITFPFEITKEAKHLISKILVVDPKKRLTIEQILEHPWCQGKSIYEHF